MRTKKSIQTTFGEKPFQARNQNRIKSSHVKFYPTKDKTFEGIIDDVINVHGKSSLYCLVSGGKDSLYVAHRLSDMGKLKAVMHVQTNIGLQMTTDFLRDYCKDQGWPLYVQEPMPKFIYASHVLESGFPGPGYHKYIMGKLKLKTMRDFALTIDRKNHCLIGGIRKFESKERDKNYPYPIASDGALWFGNPAFYKQDKEIYEYILKNNIKLSPAYKVGFGTSGDCLCGSYAQYSEKELIKKNDPKLASYIEWLEEGIQKFGTPLARKYSQWGKGKINMADMDQLTSITDFMSENPDLLDEMESLVCGDGCGPGTMKGETDF